MYVPAVALIGNVKGDAPPAATPGPTTVTEPVGQVIVTLNGAVLWQVVNDGPAPCVEASVGATGVGLTVSVKLATAVLEQNSEL